MNPEIKSYFDEHSSQAYSLLEELVLIQSGSMNKAGVDLTGQRIRQEMEAMGFICETSPDGKLGDTLIARSPACAVTGPGQNSDPDHRSHGHGLSRRYLI